MSHMKRLQCAIDEYCERDEEANATMTEEINQFIHEEITFDRLSEDAKYVMINWEQEENEMSLTRFSKDI